MEAGRGDNCSEQNLQKTTFSSTLISIVHQSEDILLNRKLHTLSQTRAIIISRDEVLSKRYTNLYQIKKLALHK